MTAELLISILKDALNPDGTWVEIQLNNKSKSRLEITGFQLDYGPSATCVLLLTDEDA